MKPGWSVLWALLTGLFLALGGYGVGLVAMYVALTAFAVLSRVQMAVFRHVTSRRLIAEIRTRGEDWGRTREAAAPASVSAPAMAGPPPDAPPTAPPPSAMSSLPLPPAGWHPDPYARHEHRYWDGLRWTDHVSDGGDVGSDPH